GQQSPPYVNDCDIRIAQAKVETPVIRGKIASSGSGESSLSIYTNSRAKSVTAAARAAKGNCQPVSPAALIHQHNGMPPENGQHGVHPTVIESGRQDRKSTRLNSSHVAISYAVFCFKKKQVDA